MSDKSHPDFDGIAVQPTLSRRLSAPTEPKVKKGANFLKASFMRGGPSKTAPLEDNTQSLVAPRSSVGLVAAVAVRMKEKSPRSSDKPRSMRKNKSQTSVDPKPKKDERLSLKKIVQVHNISGAFRREGQVSKRSSSNVVQPPSISRQKGGTHWQPGTRRPSHSDGAGGAPSQSFQMKGNMFLGEELSALPIFENCSQPFMDELCSSAHTQSYGPGSTIIEDKTEGRCSSGQCMLLIMRGTVNLFIADMKVQHLDKGDWFGETVMLGIEDHLKGTMKAETACTVCEIRREDFVDCMKNHEREFKFFDSLCKKHTAPKLKLAGTLEHTVDLMNGLSKGLLQRIDDQLVRRMFFPGQRMLIEGDPGDELYMLVRGRVCIEIAGRVVRVERRGDDFLTLKPMAAAHAPPKIDINQAMEALVLSTPQQARSPSPDHPADPAEKGTAVDPRDDMPACFGELGLLGMQPVRSATVAAQTVCQVRVLFRPIFLRSLEEHGESLSSMTDFFEKRYNTSTKTNSLKLAEVQIFQEVGCCAGFLEFLGQHLEDRMYISGMRIIDENLPDDRCMFLITSGNVTVVKEGVEVATLGAGAVVGEITVLGLASKRSSTVVAAGMCHTQVLHQSIVVRGLELFPEERQKVLMMAFKKTGFTDDDAGAVADGGKPKKKGRDLAYGSAGTHRAFMKVLKASPLFASTSEAFVEEISTVATDRIYMPGDLIIEQGTRGDSMFIMVSGQAGVFVSNPDSMAAPARRAAEKSEGPMADDERSKPMPVLDRRMMSRVGTLHTGSITGELAMLGVSLVRSATIEAETICSMWEISQEKALEILERFPQAQKRFSELVVKHLERTVPARVLSLPLVKGFDRNFRTLLGLYCERSVLFHGQAIVREGQFGDKMFIINLGRAQLEKKGVTIKTYVSGSHFGSTAMLGVHKNYVGTLIVMQTCHVLALSRNSWIQALEHYPACNVANQLKVTEKRITEDLKQAIQRISARKFIWKRYQGMVNPDAQDASDKVLTDSEMIHKVYEAWLKAAEDLRALRKVREKERDQYRVMMEGWVKKKREALKQIKYRQDEEARRLDAVCPFRQRAAEEKSTWEPSRRGRATVPLPPVTACFKAATPDSAQLVELLKEWPTPRPSPFYNLRVWNVLADSLETPGNASPLLPLLTGPPNTAETDPSATAEPLCASPFSGEEGNVGSDYESQDSDRAFEAVLSHSYTDELSHQNSGRPHMDLRRCLSSIVCHSDSEEEGAGFDSEVPEAESEEND